MATPPILILTDVLLSFGGNPLLEGAAIQVSTGDRICLVGRNGSGKSTMLKIVAGMIEFDAGDRFVQPGTTVRYLAQEPDLSGYETVLDYVQEGLDEGVDPFRASYLLGELGLDETLGTKTLSGGEKRRAALARAIAPKPDILLLDEPTNHLDLPAIAWLEAELKAMRSAIVFVSHDRRFLSHLSKSVVWLDRGAARRLDRGFDEFEDWRDGILEQEMEERRKLDQKIASEMEWKNKGVTARRKRNMGRLRALMDLRTERKEQKHATASAKMSQVEGQQAGRKVIEAYKISKSFGDTLIVEDFSTVVKRGDRVGLVGPNGAGKTTILKMLTGELKPDAGTVKNAKTIDMAVMDQGRESLHRDTSLSAALTGGTSDTVVVNGQPRHVHSVMKDFLFSPSQARTPIKDLSGGERGRLMLARALVKPSNLLVLDEPTNDLDLETLDVLQEMLADYQGTVLLVSHDRDFLDRVATSVIAYEGKGRWVDYAGGYSDMLAQGGGAWLKDEDVSKASSKKPAAKPKPKPAEPKKSVKLSYKDKYALETLPGEIAALEDRIKELVAVLADPTLYTRDTDAFRKASSDLDTAKAELAEKEDEWLRVEMLREELEQA